MSEEKIIPMQADNGMINLDLSETRKQSVCIDNDPDRVMYLNLSDMSTLTRLKETYPKIADSAREASEKASERISDDADGEEVFDSMADMLNELDADVRAYIDYIFDSDVSAVCAPDGSMFDMFNGKFRFEIIIEQVSKLYTNNLSLEYRKMSARMQAKVGKYTGRKKSATKPKRK